MFHTTLIYLLLPAFPYSIYNALSSISLSSFILLVLYILSDDYNTFSTASFIKKSFITLVTFTESRPLGNHILLCHFHSSCHILLQECTFPSITQVMYHYLYVVQRKKSNVWLCSFDISTHLSFTKKRKILYISELDIFKILEMLLLIYQR